MPQCAVRRGVAVARDLLSGYASSRGELHPPVPIHEIAQWLGLQVNLLGASDDECLALVSGRHEIIERSGIEQWRRQRFALARGIAHTLLQHPPPVGCTDWETAYYDAEAEECARELLIPSDLLRRWYDITSDTDVLARVFDVGANMIAAMTATGGGGRKIG